MKAALLEVASGMSRFYLGRGAGIVVVLSLASAARSWARRRCRPRSARRSAPRSPLMRSAVCRPAPTCSRCSTRPSPMSSPTASTRAASARAAPIAGRRAWQQPGRRRSSVSADADITNPRGTGTPLLISGSGDLGSRRRRYRPDADRRPARQGWAVTLVPASPPARPWLPHDRAHGPRLRR